MESRESAQRLSRGKKATRTWFQVLEISGIRSYEKMLLFFSRASWKPMQEPKASKVSLVASRFDGTRFQRLNTEPISLREIGYQDGELLFFSSVCSSHYARCRLLSSTSHLRSALQAKSFSRSKQGLLVLLSSCSTRQSAGAASHRVFAGHEPCTVQ